MPAVVFRAATGRSASLSLAADPGMYSRGGNLYMEVEDGKPESAKRWRLWVVLLGVGVARRPLVVGCARGADVCPRLPGPQAKASS